MEALNREHAAYYTEEIIFNHQPISMQESSTASFLKESSSGTLSQSQTSKEYKKYDTQHLMRCLSRASNRALHKAEQMGKMLKKEIEIREEKQKSKDRKVKVIKLKDLLVEEQENNCKFKERPITDEAKDEDYGNFEVDEHLNYVQNTSSKMGRSQSAILLNEKTSQVNSNSIILDMKDCWLSSDENPRDHSTMKIQPICLNMEGSSTRRKTFEGKHSKVSSSYSDRPKGVYEEVLSLYSTAKLLALKKKYRNY